MRASLIKPIESRDGTLAKDSMTRNLLRDPFQPEKLMKRPAVNKTDLYAPSGQGFGSFVFNDYIYVWTEATPNDYPYVYDYVPEYWWGSGGGGGGGMYWENDQQVIEVPEDVFEEIEVGDTVTVSGVSPSGYNGSCLVVVDKKTAAQMGVGRGDSILITNLSNPGAVTQGGVVKKLRKCSSRSAFPYAEPSYAGMTTGQYIAPGTGLYATSEITSDTGFNNPCPSGPGYVRIRVTTVSLRTGSLSGPVIMTGTSTQNQFYSSSNGVGFTGSITEYNGVTGVTVLGGDSYVFTSGTFNNAGTGCGQSITGGDFRVETTVTIADNNAWYQKDNAYSTNKAAYDALCCP